MSYGVSLIDKAKDVCGSYYALAKRIDLAESTISQIRAGKRRLPVDAVPLIAEIIGMDVHEAVDGVLMEHAKGTKREAQMREILGKGLAAGAAAMLAFSYSAGSNYSTDRAIKIALEQSRLTRLYIVSILRKLRRTPTKQSSRNFEDPAFS